MRREAGRAVHVDVLLVRAPEPEVPEHLLQHRRSGVAEPGLAHEDDALGLGGRERDDGAQPFLEAIEHRRRVGGLVDQRRGLGAHLADAVEPVAAAGRDRQRPEEAPALGRGHLPERARLRREAERALGVLLEDGARRHLALGQRRRHLRLEPGDHVARADHDQDGVEALVARQDAREELVELVARQDGAGDVADVDAIDAERAQVLGLAEDALGHGAPALVLIEEVTLGRAPADDERPVGPLAPARRRPAPLAVAVDLHVRDRVEGRQRRAIDDQPPPDVGPIAAVEAAFAQRAPGEELGPDKRRRGAERAGDGLRHPPHGALDLPTPGTKRCTREVMSK